MQKRRLGSSDLEISPLGFGAWAAGGGNWLYAWGPQDDATPSPPSTAPSIWA